ncbi:MAG: protein-disulfide reductase DsbD domain-containing protein [Ferruginibacter sp.]
MKQFFLLTILSTFFFAANAQIENPVQWSYTAKKISDKNYELHITATLDNKWHIYSQNAGDGPEPTVLSFDKNPLVKLDGKVQEKGKMEKEYDNNFKSELRFFSHTVDFVQKIKLKSTASTLVKGSISYMVCNDKKCLPPKEVPFTLKLSGK